MIYTFNLCYLTLRFQNHWIVKSCIIIKNRKGRHSVLSFLEENCSHVLLAGSHCRDNAWRLSSSISRSRLERYCLTLRAIWASSYNFLALRKELRRTRFLCPPVCATSSTVVFVLPWLRDLGLSKTRWQTCNLAYHSIFQWTWNMQRSAWCQSVVKAYMPHSSKSYRYNTEKVKN